MAGTSTIRLPGSSVSVWTPGGSTVVEWSGTVPSTNSSVRGSGYGPYRMMRREPVSLDEQRTYQPVSLRTSPIVQAVTSREWRDTRDRDLVRWSKW